MKKQPHCAIYARVSTVHGQDTEMQIAELREYCRNRGWRIVDEYVDKGFSGRKESRPELNRLMADAHRCRWNFLAVWKFDRFARSVSHLLRALETFRSLNIQFVSLTEQLDSSTPAGMMVMTVLGACAALEASVIAERVCAGLRHARAKGKVLGRPPLRTFSPADIRRLRQERRKGTSFKKLARQFQTSVWTAHTLCKSQG